MNKVNRTQVTAPAVIKMTLEAKDIATHCNPGQFVIVRVDKHGERVPFTICDYDADAGEITLLIQVVGDTTRKIAELKDGDYVEDLVGPLGNPTELDEYERVLLVGGGIGCAVIYPQAKKRMKEGKACDIIIGAKTRELLFAKDEFAKFSRNFYITTDDGSEGEKGFVTTKLEALINAGERIDCVFVVGPMIMMKNVCDITAKYNIPTVVSMNCLMLDGTGMCGCCRLTVDGQTKYACVDGPEFDGHKIDFAEAMNRLGFYKKREADCRMLKR
ncbi:MAG: sulfide/dihydroorotate dehydrogenase-like FAD/NAD-binding protein [Clostridia bacterium]|nr:sulfide/dihydroorotate dehydrogenase-like FAD/NAD-binding protein [Clostridia bacterium]